MPNVVPASRAPSLSRSEIEAILHALDPADLRSPVVMRVNARSFTTEDVLGRLALRLERHGVVHGDTSAVVHLGARSAGIGLVRAHAIIVDPEHHAIELDAGQTAPFDRTQLPTGCAHAVVSMEALYLAQYPGDALTEMHRLLDDGGVLMFDAYVADTGAARR